MDARVFLTLIVLGLTGSPAKAESNSPPGPEAEQRAREVLREWSEECLSFTGVRGEFFRIEYDDVFQQQKHSVGSFGYLGSQHAFIQVRPAPQKPDPDSLKKNNDGRPYGYKAGDSDEWRWQKIWVLNIDHIEKKYEEYRIIDQHPSGSEPRWFVGLFSILRGLESIPAFLPGVPNQAKFDEMINSCYLHVTRETETHIWIAGKPGHATFYSEFKFYLEKCPWRLRAVQFIYPAGNTSTVFLFSNVEFNPLEWEEPDLSDYKNLNDQPLVARRPEKTERQSFQKEAGSQPAGSGSVLDLIFHLLF